MKPQKRSQKKEDAVSPVIGVMLMLVLTIVIAGLVAAFAGGLFTTVEKPTQAVFKVNSAINSLPDTDKTDAEPDDSGTEVNNGIQFRHTGGDTVYLEDITVQLKTDSAEMGINFATKQSASSRAKADTIKSRDHSTYFYMGGVEYTELNAGDSFTILADNWYDSTAATDPAIVKGRFIIFQPEGSTGKLVLQKGKEVTYSIIKTSTGDVLQRGTFIL